MKVTARNLALGVGLVTLAASSVWAAGAKPLKAQAHHEATINDIPAGAKKARIWLVLPREDPAQDIDGIKLTGPGTPRVAQGGTYGNRYAYFEVDNPGSSVKVATDFAVTRRQVSRFVNLQLAQPLSDAERLRFSKELEGNKFVPVNDKYRKMALEIVGDERNPIIQSKKIYDWVLGYVEYWVKDPKNLKASANGESEYCLATKTGNCTDFHSLYASLSRSIGIPTRMDYGSFFQGENDPLPNRASADGKDTDASYHCWLQVYARGVGWLPLDVALADLFSDKEKQDWYFGNLEPRRVTWSYGRDLTLAPAQDAGPVNAMHKVYVEVDGKPVTTWTRKFTYTTSGI